MFTTFLSSFNGFDAVLHNICKCLSKLPPIAHHAEFALRRVEDEGESRVRDLMQEQRLAGDLVDVLVAEHGLGHAREVGEFVDHPP